MAETLDVASMLNSKFEPKRANRWILGIEGVDAFICKTAARPSIKTDAIEVPFINSRRYLAGMTKFDPLAVTLHDPIAPSGAQQVMEWIRLCYESVSGRAGYADFYKRDIELKLLDPIGTVVEFWSVKGAFVTEATFGTLDYGSAELVEIALTISIDNAVLQF